ncbi:MULTISPECIES: AEC family transporter [Clostridium]|uniref:AEC family transporter n=1 Tax=Clostridium TaxID=1485 RepID=UPI0008253754|nr:MULTISPECIES: AEC family transporter [Clostridium]PJI06828.1 AEC family transporter [Clostridium sp. CT7]
MSIKIIFEQMLVLFFMMVTGFVCYKKHFVDDNGYKSMSSIIVNILNPLLIISGVLNKKVGYSGKIIGENILLVFILFLTLIIVSLIYIKIARTSKEEVSSYRLMIMFSNLGFMGIPLVSEVYGTKAIIFVAFYILGYNILIYTYGIYLAAKDNTGTSTKFELKNMFNPGVAACIIAIILFVFKITVPRFVGSFVSYMGNASVPFSMMAIGISLAGTNLKEVFMNARLISFSVAKMLIIPIVCILIMKNFGFDSEALGIFALMISMPVGSIVTLIETEYGGKDSSICSSGIALTTVFSIITIPIVSLFA